MHLIKVNSKSSGRQLIHDLLYSLNYYQNIGYLSLDTPQKREGEYHNVYELLNKSGCLDSDKKSQLFELFFLELFVYDFMVIELTNQLKSKPWLVSFMQSIYDTSLDMHIPIILLEPRSNT